MDTSTWIDRLDATIARRPRAADRAFAWAHIAQRIALSDLLTCPPDLPSAACWVEPRMAWILDDLTSAGARSDPIAVPDIEAADTAVVLAAVLDRLIVAAAAPDRRATSEQIDACAGAVTRATAARRDLAASPT